METNKATKVTKILQRADGSEVKIVAQEFDGLFTSSIGVDVFHRESVNHPWVLASNRPDPAWRQMSVDEYVKRGRSEMLKKASPAEILSVTRMIGLPMSHFA